MGSGEFNDPHFAELRIVSPEFTEFAELRIVSPEFPEFAELRIVSPEFQNSQNYVLCPQNSPQATRKQLIWPEKRLRTVLQRAALRQLPDRAGWGVHFVQKVPLSNPFKIKDIRL